MNSNELKSVLEKEKINSQAYSIFGVKGPPEDEQYVLDKEGQKWVIYYSQKGERINQKSFEVEDEACRYFLNLLLKDNSTRLK